MHRVQRCGLLLQVWRGLSACVYFWDTSMSCATAAQMQFSSRLATYMSERELPLPGDASTHENIDSHRIVSYRRTKYQHFHTQMLARRCDIV